MAEDDKGFNFQQIFRTFRQTSGNLWILLGAVGIGIILLISGNGKGPETDRRPVAAEISVKDEPEGITVAEKRLESELEATLRQIDGVGAVTAKVHLKSGSRRIWEQQSRITRRSQQQQNQLDTEESSSNEMVLASGKDGADSPVLREELAPEVDGVLVVAEGAANLRVKQILADTVMTILHLPPHRVMVTAGTGKENPQ